MKEDAVMKSLRFESIRNRLADVVGPNQPQPQSLFDLVATIKLAARLVKAINRWYDNAPDRDRVRSRLYYWYRRVWESGLSELKDVSDMIRNWQEEILNYFLDHLTNGATEGLNTKTLSHSPLAS